MISYAVAVRDGNELFLFLTIARAPAGDVYVNILHGQNGPEWKPWEPHASYHASGQHHQSSFDRKGLVFKRQRPDQNFRGAENVVTMPFPASEAHRLNKPCNSADFHSVLEISTNDLAAANTDISIDVAAPNAGAIIRPGAKIIQQIEFKDAVPWILVTVFV